MKVDAEIRRKIKYRRGIALYARQQVLPTYIPNGHSSLLLLSFLSLSQFRCFSVRAQMKRNRFPTLGNRNKEDLSLGINVFVLCSMGLTDEESATWRISERFELRSHAWFLFYVRSSTQFSFEF